MRADSHRRAGTKASRSVRIFLPVAIVLLLGGIVFAAIYYNQIAPFKAKVLAVDGKTVDMGYFLRRVRLAGGDPFSTLQVLAREMIVKEKAPKEPYNISLTEKDVDGLLREVAGGSGGSLSEAEFREWYRQQINESRLTEGQFRDISRTALLSRRMQSILETEVSPEAEQVHLHMLLVKSDSEAKLAKKELRSGADFPKVAARMAVSEELRSSGGDVGWFPRGALNREIARVAFDELAVGEISDPVPLDQNTIAILYVSERAVREMDEDSLASVRAKALDSWLAEETRKHTVEFFGFDGGYDSKTDDWVKRQLKKFPPVAQGGSP